MAKSRDPYTKFYWSDYAADPLIKRASLEVQGFWMRIIAYMHISGNPYGHLSDEKNIPLSLENVQELVPNREAAKVEILLKQIVEAKIFNVTKYGVLYSRRLVRKGDLREKRKVSGSKGGKATQSNILLKQKKEAKCGSGSGSGSGSKYSIEGAGKSSPEWAIDIQQTWNKWYKAQGLSDPTAGANGQGLKNLVKLIDGPKKLEKERLARSVDRYLEHEANSAYPFRFANFWGQKFLCESFLADDWRPPAKKANPNGPVDLDPEKMNYC